MRAPLASMMVGKQDTGGEDHSELPSAWYWQERGVSVLHRKTELGSAVQLLCSSHLAHVNLNACLNDANGVMSMLVLGYALL